MGDRTDFDVGNYNDEELLAIMDLLGNTDHHVPLTKDMIIERTQFYINRYKDQPKFKKFFLDVRTKLLAEKDALIKDSIFYDGPGARPTDDIIVGQRYKDKPTLLDDSRMVKAELSFPGIQSKPVNFIQGKNNPLKINTVQTVINVDSHYRTILDPNAVACTSSSLNSNARLYSSTNFTFTLPKKLKNVVEINLKTTQIPFDWYVFNKGYGTNYFVIDGRQHPSIIPDGNYTTGEQVKDALNKVSTDENLELTFDYSSLNNRFSVHYTGTDVSGCKIKWYSPRAEVALCVEGGAVGQKLDSNLGWLLGFRQPSNTLYPDEKIESESTLDLIGPKYFLISLDDFCNNKPNQDLISNTSNKANFSMPSYYNAQTMGDNCTPPTFNLKQQGCRARPINNDLRENLTSKQLYTVDQIRLAMSGKSADRYDSPNINDVIHRVPNIRPVVFPPGGVINYFNTRPDIAKRIYYGPVTLSTFHVRLLDDKGLIIDLNNKDWSFEIIVTQLIDF